MAIDTTIDPPEAQQRQHTTNHLIDVSHHHPYYQLLLPRDVNATVQPVLPQQQSTATATCRAMSRRRQQGACTMYYLDYLQCKHKNFTATDCALNIRWQT